MATKCLIIIFYSFLLDFQECIVICSMYFSEGQICIGLSYQCIIMFIRILTIRNQNDCLIFPYIVICLEIFSGVTEILANYYLAIRGIECKKF
jgi:hypothetical protein